MEAIPLRHQRATGAFVTAFVILVSLREFFISENVFAAISFVSRLEFVLLLCSWMTFVLMLAVGSRPVFVTRLFLLLTLEACDLALVPVDMDGPTTISSMMNFAALFLSLAVQGWASSAELFSPEGYSQVILLLAVLLSFSYTAAIIVVNRIVKGLFLPYPYLSFPLEQGPPYGLFALLVFVSLLVIELVVMLSRCCVARKKKGKGKILSGRKDKYGNIRGSAGNRNRGASTSASRNGASRGDIPEARGLTGQQEEEDEEEEFQMEDLDENNNENGPSDNDPLPTQELHVPVDDNQVVAPAEKEEGKKE